MKKTLCAALSASIVLFSAGLAPYQAAAAEFAAAPRALAPRLAPAVSVTLPTLSLPHSAPGLAAPTLSAAIPGAQLQIPGAKLESPAAAQAPAARATLQVQNRAAAVSQTMQGYGDNQNAPAESASRSGQAVDAALTGERYSDDSAVLAVSGDVGLSFAKPAGAEIRESAEAFHHDAAPQPPAPPQTPNNGDGGNGGDGSGPKGAPLSAKIVSALIALAPGALLGLPLIHGGAALVGALVVAASAGIAASPFMSARTPRWVRALPGVLVAAGGVLLTAFGFAVAPAGLHISSLILPGLITTLGGWGLVRFGRNDSKWKYMEPSEVIVTYIGALAAVTGVGLGFSLLVGPLASAGMAAASIGTLALLMQLPGWVGSAIERAAYGVYLSVGQAYRVATSVRRDTTLYKRLAAVSEAYVSKSVWNLAWLGLFVWLPILAAEAVSTIVGVAFGLAHGLIRAPVMAAWGASYALRPKSRATQTLAYMGRWLFNYNKTERFNGLEKLFIPLANSKNPAKAAFGALSIRLMQLLWLSIGTLSLAAVEIIGWPQAVLASGKPHEPALDDPGSLKIASDDLPSKVPEVEKPASVPSPLLARLLAASIGLVPLVLLAAPVMTGGGIFGAMIAGASLLVALMPLIPAKHGAAASLAGGLLAASGLFSAAAAARFLLMGLPVGAIVGMGLAALFGGIGLRQLVKKLRKEDGLTYDTDSPLYALGFVGALAVSAGLDAALLGKGGLLANSLFAVGGLGGLTLSFFLPRYLWEGVGETLRGAAYSIRSIYKGLSFWHDKTDFANNLTSYLNGLVKRWWAAGALLVAVPYIALGAAWLAEAASSLAFGLAMAVYQAPARYIWGAAYHANPNGRFTRFWAGFNRTIAPGLEGNGRSFGQGLANTFGKAMSEKTASGRPTAKALLAAVPAGLFAAAWLAGLLVNLSPLWLAGAALGLLPAKVLGLNVALVAALMGGTVLLAGIVGGLRNARGTKEPKPSYQDPDSPGFMWNDRKAK